MAKRKYVKKNKSKDEWIPTEQSDIELPQNDTLIAQIEVTVARPGSKAPFGVGFSTKAKNFSVVFINKTVTEILVALQDLERGM